MDPSQCTDTSFVTDGDLQLISKYFWTAIGTPKGLLHKVWFDLMLVHGADGLQNIQSMQKDSFVLLKSQSDGRRRLQWRFKGEFRGSPIFDDPPNPLCPVKTFQLFVCKLDLECSQIFQRPHEAVSRTTSFWYTKLPADSTMLSTMLQEICRCAGTSRVYTSLCEQVIPRKEKFYEIFPSAWTDIEMYRAPTYETSPNGKLIAPFKLCQHCLTSVRNVKPDRSNDVKGVLCSLVCQSAFMRAKDLRKEQLLQVGAATSSTAGPIRSPSIIQRNRHLLPMQYPHSNNSGSPLPGNNITPEIFKFIQHVARIQACGYPRNDIPLLFEQDYTCVQADIPKELRDLTFAVVNAGQTRQGLSSSSPYHRGNSLPRPPFPQRHDNDSLSSDSMSPAKPWRTQ